jgi:hypothetical protein
VNRLKALLGDSKRRQRGSILSSLLIIVAFLSILVGALMTELTNSFLISRTHVARMEREATLTSAVELGIHQLQIRSVPANCATDSGSLPSVSLNGSPASVTLTCHEIKPDVTTALALGAFGVDGVHDTTSGRNRYLVADSTGRLYAYAFGQTSPSWSLGLGGPLTAAPLPKPGSPAVLLAPVARANSGCASHCVALYSDGGGTPVLRCIMPASTTVSGTPGIEVPANGNFPSYAFFAGSDPGSALYVYEASAGGGCVQQAAPGNLGGGWAVGAPLVFPGPSSQRREVTTTIDDIFVLVSDGANTSLQQWQYQEVNDQSNENGEGSVTKTLTRVGARSLTALVGGRAVGYGISSTVPARGAILSLAVAGASGRIGIARITVSSGPSYAVSAGASITLGTAISRPPYWCTCPGPDLIGVGGASGRLFLLSPALVTEWTYDGAADGFPAINSTPVADANGDWYFGADDGYVYDVEIPAGPPPGQLFKAARFGPGGAIRSSPVVGTGAGCSPGPCVYFGSSTSSYFARLGITRIVDLRACASSTPCSTTAVPNPRLWARVEVGSPFIVGGRGVYVQAWSYYSP